MHALIVEMLTAFFARRRNGNKSPVAAKRKNDAGARTKKRQRIL